MSERNVFAFEFVSVDGLFEGPAPWSLDWHNVGPEFNAFVVRQLEPVDTLLFGRRTYEGMALHWPSQAARTGDPVVARLMNETPKVVFSNSLEGADWENTRLFRGAAEAEVRRLKALAGGDIAILGSSDLAASLLKAGLVDELRLMVNPIVLGSGRRVFRGLDGRIPLRLLRTEAFRSGNVLLCYAPTSERRG